MEFYYPLLNSSRSVLKAFQKLNFCLLLKAYKLQPTDPLRPVIPDNARPSRLTAAAGTKLAGASSSNKSQSSLPKALYSQHIKCLLCFPRALNITGSGFRPLSNIPHCWLPKKPGPCFSSSVADHSLKPAKDHRLGRLLPTPTT